MSDKQYIFLSGTCLWARVLKDMPAALGDETNTICKIMMECDKNKFRQLQKNGLSSMAKLYDADECFGKNKDTGDLNPIPDDLKKKLEGKTFINIKRTVKFYSERQGKDFDFGLPKVVDNFGEDVTVEIGNGSEVIAKCEVVPYTFKGKQGIKLNLEAVKVTNHIEFISAPKEDKTLDGFEFEEKPAKAETSNDNGGLFEVPAEFM